MRRGLRIAALVACVLVVADCATDGGGAGYFDAGFWYEDMWYSGGGTWTGDPGDIGPPAPRPEHPIAKPPDAPRPSQPIASPPSRPMPAPRASMSMSRGGGGGRR